MSVQFPTERAFDLELHGKDLSCGRLFPNSIIASLPILSPALIAAAAIVAILFAAHVVSSSVAICVGSALGGTGVLLSPVAVGIVYDFYQYRHTPLTKAKIEEKLRYSNVPNYELDDYNLDPPDIHAVTTLATKYAIDLAKKV